MLQVCTYARGWICNCIGNYIERIGLITHADGPSRPRLGTFSTITACIRQHEHAPVPSHPSCSHPDSRSQDLSHGAKSLVLYLGPIRPGTSVGWTKMEQQYGGALYTRRPGLIETATLSKRHTCSAPVLRPNQESGMLPARVHAAVQRDVPPSRPPFLRADQQIIAAVPSSAG
jgi:hypothetical protein